MHVESFAKRTLVTASHATRVITEPLLVRKNKLIKKY